MDIGSIVGSGMQSAQTTHKVKVVQYSDDLGAALQMLKQVERRSCRGPLTRAQKRGLAEKIRDARQTVKKELALTTLALENCEADAAEAAAMGNGEINVNVQLGAPQPVIPIAPQFR